MTSPRWTRPREKSGGDAGRRPLWPSSLVKALLIRSCREGDSFAGLCSQVFASLIASCASGRNIALASSRRLRISPWGIWPKPALCVWS